MDLSAPMAEAVAVEGRAAMALLMCFQQVHQMQQLLQKPFPSILDMLDLPYIMTLDLLTFMPLMVLKKFMVEVEAVPLVMMALTALLFPKLVAEAEATAAHLDLYTIRLQPQWHQCRRRIRISCILNGWHWCWYVF